MLALSSTTDCNPQASALNPASALHALELLLHCCLVMLAASPTTAHSLQAGTQDPELQALASCQWHCIARSFTDWQILLCQSPSIRMQMCMQYA